MLPIVDGTSSASKHCRSRFIPSCIRELLTCTSIAKGSHRNVGDSSFASDNSEEVATSVSEGTTTTSDGTSSV